MIEIYDAVRREVIGREDETQLILAALAAGRDLLLEGPPGTSKSTILRAITGADHTPFHFVEGNADLTPAKLLGHHSPARVLEEGYTEENFMPGPLPLAMEEGGFLYIEEFNRVPEDTLNALITAMAEREVAIPRAGRVRAKGGFRVIAAMNPFDNIGTERLSGAVADRLCRVRMDYQSEGMEREIVAKKTASENSFLIRLAVEAARRSRAHPDLRSGASVRAATDFVLIAEKLADLRGANLSDTRDPDTRWTLVSAAQTAFSIKVKVRESSGRSADGIVSGIILEILDGNYGPEDSDEKPGSDESSPEETGRSSGDDEKGSGSNTGSSPALSGLLAGGGQIYSSGEEAATAGRNRGGRMFRGFVRDHPRLAERLEEKDAGLAALEEALREEADDLEILWEMLDLYDRADLRALARKLAGELVIRKARRNIGARSGKGKLASVRHRGEAGELDLERTLETLVEKPRPADEDLFVFERRRRRRSYALMLDVSGSMKGSSIFRAALALASVAASVGESSDDAFAVVAFWREAAVLKHLHERVETNVLLDRLFSLSGRGLTDLGLGLRAGLEELEIADTQERVGILFGDGLQTAGEPAAPFAAAFPKLHVLATGESEESLESCRVLAALGSGTCAEVPDASGVPAAVNACLAA
jgi:MoxR-like ATPase/Mg-chelatase subunit ChlD